MVFYLNFYTDFTPFDILKYFYFGKLSIFKEGFSYLVLVGDVSSGIELKLFFESSFNESLLLGLWHPD